MSRVGGHDVMLTTSSVIAKIGNPFFTKYDYNAYVKYVSELNALIPEEFRSHVSVDIREDSVIIGVTSLRRTVRYPKNATLDFVTKSVLNVVRDWVQWDAFRRQMRPYKRFYDLAKRLVREKQGFLYVDNAEIPNPSGGSSVEPCYILRSRTFCAKVSLARISKNRNATQLFNELVQESLETRRLHRLLESNGIKY